MFVAYGNRGNTYRNQGNLDLAIADFDRAIEINPQYFQAYNLRGRIYAARSDHNRAISEYTDAIKLDPVYVEAYVNRGLAYEALGLTANANSDFRRAQSIDPSDQVSKARLAASPPQASQAVTAADGGANTPVDVGAISAAMSRLSIALPMDIAAAGPVKKPLDDLNREPCDQQAIVALGLALDKIGRKREAANAQLSFSKACGGYAPSLKMAANMLLALSDYAGAATAATELVNLNPHDDGNFYLRATAYDRGGSSRKAIDDYLAAIELFGNKAAISSDSYLAVARNYEKLGQFCDAGSIIEAWVALNPTRNDSSRMQAIIADYNAKGKCEAANSRSRAFQTPTEQQRAEIAGRHQRCARHLHYGYRRKMGVNVQRVCGKGESANRSGKQSQIVHCKRRHRGQAWSRCNDSVALAAGQGCRRRRSERGPR